LACEIKQQSALKTIFWSALYKAIADDHDESKRIQPMQHCWSNLEPKKAIQNIRTPTSLVAQLCHLPLDNMGISKTSACNMSA